MESSIQDLTSQICAGLITRCLISFGELVIWGGNWRDLHRGNRSKETEETSGEGKTCVGTRSWKWFLGEIQSQICWGNSVCWGNRGPKKSCCIGRIHDHLEQLVLLEVWTWWCHPSSDFSHRMLMDCDCTTTPPFTKCQAVTTVALPWHMIVCTLPLKISLCWLAAKMTQCQRESKCLGCMGCCAMMPAIISMPAIASPYIEMQLVGCYL